jgi:hypothetical protein
MTLVSLGLRAENHDHEAVGTEAGIRASRVAGRGRLGRWRTHQAMELHDLSVVVMRSSDVAFFLPFRYVKGQQTVVSRGTKRKPEITGFYE